MAASYIPRKADNTSSWGRQWNDNASSASFRRHDDNRRMNDAPSRDFEYPCRKPELHRELDPRHNGSVSSRSNHYLSPASSRNSNSGVPASNMCNPRQVRGYPRGREPDVDNWRGGGNIEARGCLPRSSIPARSNALARGYNVNRGNPESSHRRPDNRGYSSRERNQDASGRYPISSDYPERSTAASRTYPSNDRYHDRDPACRRDYQRDDTRSWDDEDRMGGGRDQGRFYSKGDKERFSSKDDRAAYGDQGLRSFSSNGGSQSLQAVSRRHVGNSDHRPSWTSVRDAPPSGSSHNAEPRGVRDYETVNPTYLPKPLADSEAPAYPTNKRGYESQEHSFPRKRWCGEEKESTAMPDSPSKLAQTGRWQPASPPSKASREVFSGATVLNKQAPPAFSHTANISANNGKSTPVPMTRKPEFRPASTAATSKGDVKKPGVIIMNTSSVSKVSSTPTAAPSKKTTSIGIPMRWLKPVNRPKVVKKQVPKPKAPMVNTESPSILSIPRKVKKEQNVLVPSSPTSNRMVTDSEGGSTVSNARDLLAMAEQHKSKPEVPPAIVTTKAPKIIARNGKTGHRKSKKASQLDVPDYLQEEEESNEDPPLESDSSSAGDMDSVEEEGDFDTWGSNNNNAVVSKASASNEKGDGSNQKRPQKLRLKLSPSKIAALIAEKRKRKLEEESKELQVLENDQARPMTKLKERGRTKKNRKSYLKHLPEETAEERQVDEEQQRIERIEEKRIREEAKPLTAAQIREILGEDDFDGSTSTNWVRRSVRQPSLALLNSKPLKALVAGLKNNSPEMTVLKMKKYINDPDAPSCVIDAALEALEENSNCEVLYIQVSSFEAMAHCRHLHLLYR